MSFEHPFDGRTLQCHSEGVGTGTSARLRVGVTSTTFADSMVTPLLLHLVGGTQSLSLRWVCCILMMHSDVDAVGSTCSL